MKAFVEKTILSFMLVMALGLTSCENDDWRLKEAIVGSWYWYYEDRDLYEEVTYNFTPDGKWTYLYIYEDIYGRYNSEVDGGYYDIDMGRLLLYSNFYDDAYYYDVEIHGRRMILWDGEYETELTRLR